MTAPQAVHAVHGDSGTVAVGLLPAQSPDSGECQAKFWDQAECALRGRPESVKLAREFTRETLAGWGMSAMCDDVTWVMSELVTNALTHGLAGGPRGQWERPIHVRLTIQLAHVLCMVADPGGGEPVLKEPDYLRECGRGLQVVESCSEKWGWNPLDGGGKVIWAAFRVPA